MANILMLITFGGWFIYLFIDERKQKRQRQEWNEYCLQQRFKGNEDPRARAARLMREEYAQKRQAELEAARKENAK